MASLYTGLDALSHWLQSDVYIGYSVIFLLIFITTFRMCSIRAYFDFDDFAYRFSTASQLPFRCIRRSLFFLVILSVHGPAQSYLTVHRSSAH